MTKRRTSTHTCVAVLVVFVALACVFGVADANETIDVCGSSSASIMTPVPESGYGLAQNCGSSGGDLDIDTGASEPGGSGAFWIANAPAGLLIESATDISLAASEINQSGSGYGGGFFWDGDGETAAVYPGDPGAGPYSGAGLGFPSPDFGFKIVCDNPQTCTAPANFSVSQMVFTVQETDPPTLTAAGLWNATGWVSGSWPLTANGDSASGVCALTASLNGQQVATTSFPDNPTVWHQCDASTAGGLSTSVNTAQYPNGPDALRVDDLDAAGLASTATETVHVDNEVPTMSLGGPTNASSTSGTQYIAETVNTGPSGAYGANCSVDGGPAVFYPGTSGRVPVSGLGPHTVQCVGQNNALNASGQRASTQPATYGIDIQQPTVEGITFSHLADALRCRTVTRRIEVHGHRYVIERDGHRIVVYSRSRRVRRRVRSCHARTARRRVLVVLRRDGKPVRRHGHIVKVRRTETVVPLPHRVNLVRRRIRHGRGSTVSGFLGLADGTALAGQAVEIYGAPNNGDAQFAAISSATTNADGVWVAKIPAGPSRLLEAVYGGNTIDGGATSTAVKLIVPARIELSISPRVVPWRGAITVRGRLLGGDVPPDGVALRFLVRYPRSPQRSTLLALRTDSTGGFRFKWSYHRGDGVATYPFSVATTAAETDYPFAAASSARIRVTFGQSTPRSHHRGHRHRRR